MLLSDQPTRRPSANSECRSTPRGDLCGFFRALETSELLTLPTRNSETFSLAEMGCEQAGVQRPPLPSCPLLLLQSA